jgi:hypothetical protein
MIARLLSLTLLASLLAPVARTDDLDNIIFRGPRHCAPPRYGRRAILFHR